MEHSILMTGGASGVGAATAKSLVSRGHRVITLDIKKPNNNDLVFVQCDLSDPESIDTAVASLDGRFSSLINIAGVPVGRSGSDLTMRVNLFGLRHLTERVWDCIVDNGTVVNVASIAGNNWRKRREFLTDVLSTKSFDDGVDWWHQNEEAVGVDAYTFSKEAVVLYTMQMAGKGLERGIRVNDVGPGPVKTPIFEDFSEDAGADAMQRMIDMVGRAAEPEDIAEAIVTLAEGKIGWLNGQHIIVDGGMTAGFSSNWRR